MKRRRRMESYMVEGEINVGYGWLFRFKQFFAYSKRDAAQRAAKHWRRKPMFRNAKVRIKKVRFAKPSDFVRGSRYPP